MFFKNIFLSFQEEKLKAQLILAAADLSDDGSDNEIMTSISVPDKISCAFECLKDSECKSILMERRVNGQNYCHLIDGRRFSLTRSEAKQSDYYHYYVVVMETVDVMVTEDCEETED